jgi:murein DD-endopeptidase MepM/ murein hydrolase activator NlpD
VLHARTRPALHRRVLPVLLLGTCTVAFSGLAVLAPGATGTEPDALTRAETRAVTLAALELERERVVARASRSRSRAEAKAAAKAAAEAEARAKAEAEAAAAAKAEAERAAAAKAEAERAAAAKAEAERAAAAKAKAERAAAAKAKAAAAPASGGAACPVPNASFTDTYGATRSGGRAHQGTDLLAPHGSPVYAVVSGRVRTASSSLGGISLYIDGDNGETYFYAHNSSNVASNGQRVQAGDLVAKVGSTGNAGGTNHVHFEREVGGRSVNPYDFLRRLC